MPLPAVYKTIPKRIVATPATTRATIHPAEYQSAPVDNLIVPAREVKQPSAAVNQTVKRRELMTPADLAWHTIPCDTKATGSRLKDIQRALAAAGFDPGPIDGYVQRRTMAAVNAYQHSEGLPVGHYLNIESVRSLGVLSN